MSEIKNRELSQFGSFVNIEDGTQSVGIATTSLPFVGIGTVSPTSKLHIVGDVLVSGALTVSSASLGSLSLQNGYITVGLITAISGSNISYSGIGTISNFTSSVGIITNLSGIAVTYTNITGTSATITNLTGTASTITTLQSTTTNIATANIVTGVVTTLTGTAATITNLNSSNGSIINLTGTAGTITTFNSTNGNISGLSGIGITYTNITGTSGTITNLTGTGVTYTNLTSTNATITNLSGTGVTYTNLTVTNGSVSNFSGTTATITNITGTSGTVTNLTGTAATITNLNSSNGSITNLTGTAGTITTFNSTTGSITNISGSSAAYTTATSNSLFTNNGYINSGIVTTVSGTNINYTGIATFNKILLQNGIVTATTGIITYYGDGQGLINIPASIYLVRDGVQPPLGVGFTSINIINSNGGATIASAIASIDIGKAASGLSSHVQFKNASGIFSGSSNFTFDGTNVSIPSGTVTALNFNSTSDVNLKENIKTFENALEVVSELRGVQFNWKNDHKPCVGIIAQELEEVLPELVTDTDPKTVNYNGIIGVLIEAIKELKEEVTQLKSTINNQ